MLQNPPLRQAAKRYRQPWKNRTMKLNLEHLNFENHSRELIGLTISKVEYSEIDYDSKNSTPYYSTHFRNLDSVDFSIFFHCNNNSIVEIFWDDKFFQFGLGIKINEPSDFSNSKKWDVSNNNLWKSFIGKTIIDIKVNWETVTEEQAWKTQSFIYPQDIKINFSNNKNIFISAAGFLNQNDSEVCGMLDNLTVTDDEDLARKVKMII